MMRSKIEARNGCGSTTTMHLPNFILVVPIVNHLPQSSRGIKAGARTAQRHEREGSPVQPRGRSRSNSRPRMEEIVPRGYLDQYRDEEIQEVLMEMDQGEVEEDVFGSVLENSSSRPNSTAGSSSTTESQNFPSKPRLSCCPAQRLTLPKRDEIPSLPNAALPFHDHQSSRRHTNREPCVALHERGKGKSEKSRS
jgi:hypothetical protein